MKKGFLWGVAHAAFQVEGSPAPSDWTAWTHTPGKIADGSNADQCTDFWNRFDRDFKLAEDLGCRAFRMSLAWERIQTSATSFDEAALDRYVSMLQAMRARSLEPVLTLHHFVIPAWLEAEGGVRSPHFAEHFTNYVRKVCEYFRSKDVQIKWWITFNEPMVLVRNGFLGTAWTPGVQSGAEGLKALRNLILAHRKSYPVLKEFYPEAQVSVATHYRPFEAGRPGLLNRGLAKLLDYLFNDQLLQALLTGRMKLWLPGSRLIIETAPDAGGSTLDFHALNFYGRTLVELSASAPYMKIYEGSDGPRTEMDWEVHPPSFKRALLDSQRRYKLPMMVTENGIADEHDSLRPEFLKGMIGAMEEAVGEGAEVIGYMHWSLTDNFEWSEGLEKRFGLVAVNYETLELRPRPSYTLYRDIISKSISSESL